jgi:predicted metal-dependent hydrolase
MRRLSQAEEEEKFREGLERFNAGRFFEAHESWEEIWLAAPEPEKTFLQGIIQVSAAFHHYRRDNRAGAESLLGEGLRKLDRFPSVHRGLAIGELREFVRLWLVALAEDNYATLQRVPRLEGTKDAIE